MKLINVEKMYIHYQELCDGVVCADCPFNRDGCVLDRFIKEQPIVDAIPVAFIENDKKELMNDCLRYVQEDDNQKSTIASTACSNLETLIVRWRIYNGM